MLAVGDSADDRIQRLTLGESFTCCYGSESEHRQLSEFCLALQDLLHSMDQQLSDFSPDELQDLLSRFVKEDRRP